jgi:hypothetical protein
MHNFIQLKNASPESVAGYKREVRAIVVDRAADHVQQIMARYRRPTAAAYEKALQEGLMGAKLDVLAELFRIMHDLARQNAVAQWSRNESGLKRQRRSPETVIELINAYDRIVRYVSSLKAKREPIRREEAGA